MATFGIRGPNGRGTQQGRRWARSASLVAVFATLSVGVHSAAAAEPSLLGEWRFDEAAGDTAFDSGPHGLDGRLGGADGADGEDPQRIGGVRDGALRFDGDTYVRLPDAAELAPQTLSVEAVVRASSSPGAYSYVVSRGGRGCFAGSYGLYTGAAGGMAFYVFDGERYVVSATARPSDVWDGSWHHVAGTFDGGRLRLYLDGQPVGDPSTAVMQIDYEATSPSAAFGRYVGSCDLPYRGDLDVVRLWSGSRTSDRVASDARRELGLSSPSPSGPLPQLPAAAPPTTLKAAPPAGAPAAAPGAPKRACALALSRRRIPVRRRTIVGVRVTLRGAPARAVRVVARQPARRKPIAAARTGSDGRVRLVIRARRAGRVHIRATVSPSCSPGVIRVRKRG